MYSTNTLCDTTETLTGQDVDVAALMWWLNFEAHETKLLPASCYAQARTALFYSSLSPAGTSASTHNTPWRVNVHQHAHAMLAVLLPVESEILLVSCLPPPPPPPSQVFPCDPPPDSLTHEDSVCCLRLRAPRYSRSYWEL